MNNTSGHQKGVRTSYLDRTWLNHWSVVTMMPIVAPTASRLRAEMHAFMTANPSHPLCCTLEDGGRRWRPVSPDIRTQHLETVIVDAGEFDRRDPFGYLNKHRPDSTYHAPYKVLVGPDSMSVYFAHAAGDAVVFSPFSVLMALGDVDGLAPLRSNAGLGLAGRILLKEVGRHGNEWWQHLRAGVAGPPAGPAGEPRDGEPGTDAVSFVLDAAEWGQFRVWRKATHPEVSVAALMASAAYRALSNQGLPMNPEGFYTLVDLRRHLPKGQQLRPGNLAKSVYVAAAMDNPVEVGVALRHLVDSGRAVPALFAGAASAALGRHSEPAESVGGAQATMIFNSMLRLPGADHIPWTDRDTARYFTTSFPVAPNGISVMACGVEDKVHFSATFDPRFVDRNTMRLALDELQDMRALLEPGSAMVYPITKTIDPMLRTNGVG